MASPFSKYVAYIFSLADYIDGVGYSSVSDDFPVELGPATLYDTVSGIQTFVGRDPATGLPLIVTGYDRYITEIVTHGVQGASDGISPPYGIEPDVCSLQVEVTAASVLTDIQGIPKHVAYGVYNCQPEAEPDDLPAPLVQYYIHSVMPAAKWAQIYDGLIARGADQARLDTWRANHPEATPEDVRLGFAALVRQVERAMR